MTRKSRTTFRRSTIVAAPLLLLALAGADHPDATIDVRIDRLRSDQGIVRLCLTKEPKSFPNCRADPRALKLNLPASAADHATFANVSPGTYAIAILHDENGNGKLDTFMKVPREGFGFSGNPAIRMGPPRFGEAVFAVDKGTIRQTVRMRYFF